MVKAEARNGIILSVLAGWGALLPVIWIIREWRGCVNGISPVSGTPPEWDFTIFWEAGRLALARQFDVIANYEQFHQAIMAGLHYDIGLSPFAYSPVSFLIFAPLGWLPLPVAYAIWVMLGTSILLYSLRRAGLSWPYCGFVLASPAFLYNLLLGQNGAFTAALLISTMTLTGRRDVCAGLSGAWLLIKPQLALLVPFMWWQQRHRMAITGALFGGLLLCCLPVLMFGLHPWILFFVRILPTMNHVMTAPFPQTYQVSAITVFMLARASGMSVLWAQSLQGLTVLGAAIAVMLIWRRPYGFETRFCLTMMLALLAMPYGYVYDMTGYGAALTLVAERWGFSLPLMFFWLWPAVARNVTMLTGLPITPLVVLAAIIWLARLPARPP